MKRREGGVVGGSVDVSSSLWRDKVFPSIVAITLLGVASLFANECTINQLIDIEFSISSFTSSSLALPSPPPKLP